MKTTVTLVHKNCGRNCRICAYGKLDPIGYGEVQRVAETLMRQGYQVHLYDFEIGDESIALFRRTRQFERRNPGWMNVTSDFDPNEQDLTYINQLRTAIAISLHGSTAEVHRKSSGKHDYDDIVNFIKTYPRKYALPLGINYVVSRHNLEDMRAMVELCKGFEVEFLEFIPLGYSGNVVDVMGKSAVLGTDEKYRARQVVAEYRDQVDFAVEMDAIWGPDFLSDPHAVCRFFAAALPNNYCNAGVNHIAIRLNDMKVFPCPCMAGMDGMAIGDFDGEKIQIEENWLEHRGRIGEPCRSCDQFARCQGGCRLTAMSDHQIEHGEVDRYAGFRDCLYNLAKQRGE